MVRLVLVGVLLLVGCPCDHSSETRAYVLDEATLQRVASGPRSVCLELCNGLAGRTDGGGTGVGGDAGRPAVDATTCGRLDGNALYCTFGPGCAR